MRCEQYRELLSAQLDGEERPSDRAVVDAHLDRCGDCRDWLDRAAAVTRLARTSLVGPVPDLTAAVLEAAPRPRRVRLVPTLRLLLGLVSGAQLVLGLAQIIAGAGGVHGHSQNGLDSLSGHLWHESAAWNVAVGAGFLFIAVRRTRPIGLLPTLTAFVVTLILLSVNDLVVGWVEPARLVSHGFILAGYLIVVLLSRPALDPGEPPARRRPDRSRWRAHFDDQDETVPAVPRLRVVPPPAPQGRFEEHGPARRVA